MSEGPESPKDGVWMVYNYDLSAYIVSVHVDLLSAVLAQGNTGDHIGFLPYNTQFREAVNEWERKKKSDL